MNDIDYEKMTICSCAPGHRINCGSWFEHTNKTIGEMVVRLALEKDISEKARRSIELHGYITRIIYKLRYQSKESWNETTR